ncbi:hypothetical protein A5819_001304 [Enterococcus sp. 7E2_DIV0204]|nr:hypothetical protein A5819_001304 [Enterococcus sp. 7E2_DIV0204]OTP51277.1 hypothetical protein A5884_000472 [Enterococcus sp. 7D2_DIV0200]
MLSTDWILIIWVALTMVLFLESLYFLLQFIHVTYQVKKLPSNRIKNKKKKRMIARKRQQFLKKKKVNIRYSTIFLILAIMFGGMSGYFFYYQAMTLTKDDSDSVAKAYYLLRDFEKEIIHAKEKKEVEEKVQKNIRYLATAMASYGSKKASKNNSREGQIILNRYYNAIKQVGMNASTQTNNFYGNTSIVDDFLMDVKKIQRYEKSTFTYYKVDKSAFLKEN